MIFGLILMSLGVIWWARNEHRSLPQQQARRKFPLGSLCPTSTELYAGAGMGQAHELAMSYHDREVADKFLEFLARPAEAAVAAAPVITFAQGEPRTFEEYGGQASTLGLLKDALMALRPTEQCIRPQMFAGWAGAGKTLLAKIVANELTARNSLHGLPPARFMEYMPVSLGTVEALDKMMREVQQNPGAVVFMDEVHAVAGKEHFLKFYQVLEENRYRFENEAVPVTMPPTTYLSATTDYGALAEAFKRRWTIHFFQPSSPEQIKGFVARRGASVFPISEPALDFIVNRMYYSGAPWEALQIYQMAVNAAKAAQRPQVEPEDVNRVYELHGIDSMGLRQIDRQVIAAMFQLVKRKTDGEQHFAGSEDSVVSMGRVDKSEFKSSVRPRLMSRGLLEIRPYWGHTLTEKAESMYAALRVA